MNLMNANDDHEIITFGDFTRVIKWYEYRDNLNTILKENIKNQLLKEYYFISSQWINDFRETFHYEQLKHYITSFKKNNNNVNPLTKKHIEILYEQIKDTNFVSLEKKKKLKIIPNNNIIQKELYINDNCIIKNYYNNFILIDKQTLEEFKKEYKIGDPIKFDILLGSGIFLISISSTILEVGIFSENSYLYKIFFFKYSDINEYQVEIERITKEGINSYFNYYNIKKDNIIVENLRKNNGKEIIVINLDNYQINSKTPIELKKDIKKNKILNGYDDISIRRGIINLENKTSRLNSIIHILISIKEIRDYLLDKKNRQDIEKYNHIYILSSTLIKIIEQLYSKIEIKENYVEAFNIILHFLAPGKSNIHMDQYLLFILDTLHDELNKSLFKKTNQINLISFESPLNTEEKSIQVFSVYYNDYYKSIIADNFNWIRKRNYRCQKCSISLYSLQALPYIEFDLDEIHKYTFQQHTEYKKIINDYSNNQELLKQRLNEYYNKKLKVPIHITDCFKYYLTKNETTNIVCNTSNQQEKHIFNNCIYKTPKYFCLILNRKPNTDGINIDLSGELQLENYVDDRNEYKKYQLFGILVNTQSNNIEKHYIAIIRNFDNNWVIFDNDKITKVDNEKKIYNSISNKTRVLIYKGIKY